MNIWKRGIWGLFLAMVFLGPIAAQDVAWVQTTRGWIGISYNISGDEEITVVIGDVEEGSPAQEAGIRIGDALTHLDGQPISREVLTALQRSIEVGDLVRLTILSGDERSREILVEAASRNSGGWFRYSNSGQSVIHLDSVRGNILEALDSARVGMITRTHDGSGQISIRISEHSSEGVLPGESHMYEFSLTAPALDSLSFSPDVMFLEQSRTLPFEAVVVTSKATEPFRVELHRIGRELTVIRRQEQSRVREIEAGINGPTGELISRDPQIREIRVMEDALVLERLQVEEQLSRVSEETMQRKLSEIQELQEAVLNQRERSRPESRSSERSGFEAWQRSRAQERARQEDEIRVERSISNYYVGQNFVAGAQLNPLNPELAEYFGVDEGVLVTGVIEGTPAFESGLMGGDVIVRVGRELVKSLDDLRFNIGYQERPLRLRIVRKGDQMDIIIR